MGFCESSFSIPLPVTSLSQAGSHDYYPPSPRKESCKQQGDKIVQKLSYRAPIEFVNPAYTSSTCPKCGSKLESRNGLVVCECDFTADRQFLGAFNVFMRGVGVPLSGGEASDLLSNEPGGKLRLMSPKSLVRVNLRGRTFAHTPS